MSLGPFQMQSYEEDDRAWLTTNKFLSSIFNHKTDSLGNRGSEAQTIQLIPDRTAGVELKS